MTETSLIAEALKGLLVAGPVATILGIICYVLWKQNTNERARHLTEEHELLTKLDKQHDKMLRLAVRVQRAVEVLAGIEHDETEIETVLNEDDRREEERRRRLLGDKEG